MTTKWQWAVLAALLAGCSAPMVTPDAGEVDAGLPSEADAGVDAGVLLVPVWSSIAATPVASGLWGSVLTFDPVGKRFILHGGNTYPTGAVINDTFSYDLATNTWSTLVTTGDAPPLRYCHCAAYLPAQRQVLIVGGRDANANVNSAFTLSLETNTWQAVTGPTPTGAIGCNAHFLPKLGKAIVFGGDGPSGVNANTWSYDPAARAFTQLMPATNAPARRDAMAAYDPIQERYLLYGGAERIRSTYLDDVAFFDGTRWFVPTPPRPRPSPRRYGASGYTTQLSRWLIFGGTNDTDDFGDLWIIDPIASTFERLDFPGGPSARGFAASGIDEDTGRLFVFGGLNVVGFTAYADSWVLRFDRR